MKLTALAMFVNNISVQNQQTYSFASFANGLVLITLVAAIVIATAYIPTSPHPAKAFLRLLRRFFRQAEFIMSQLALDRDQRKGWAVRWKMLFFRNDLLELPRKLATLAQRIDNRLLHDTTSEKIQALVANLQALAYQVNELTEARTIQQSKLLLRELLTDVRAWRVAVQNIFGQLSKKPEAIDSFALRSELDATLDRLEKRMEAVLDKADEPFVVQRIEEPSNVRVEHPVHLALLDGHRYGVQGVVLVAPRPESIAESLEVGLVDGVEHLDSRALDDLVFQRGNADGPLSSVRLGDVYPLDRLGPVRSALQSSGQVLEIPLKVLAIHAPRYAVYPGRGVPLYRVVRLTQAVDVVYVVPQRGEP